MGNLRQNILKTAEAEFVKFGIRSVSIDDLCNILHISKKTFYTEFKQKDELVTLVLENISETNKREDAEYSKVNSSANAIDMSLCYKQPLLQSRRRKHEKFMRDLVKYYPDIHKTFFDSKRESIKNVICQNILKGVKEGLYREELSDITTESPFLLMVYNWFMGVMIDGEDLYPLKVDGYMRLVCNNKGFEYYQSVNNN